MASDAVQPDYKRFNFKLQEFEVDFMNSVLRLKALIMKLDSSYFLWIGDSTAQLSSLSLSVPISNHMVHSSSLYHGNSLFPAAGSTPETTLSKRLSKRLACPVYLSLNINGEVIEKWDLVDPVSHKTPSQEVELQLLRIFDDVLRTL